VLDAKRCDRALVPPALARARAAVLLLGGPAQSGFKLAPVDTNLFPGGFNNLGRGLPAARGAGRNAAIEKICPEAKTWCWCPRITRATSGTGKRRDAGAILRQTGLEVRIGSLNRRSPTGRIGNGDRKKLRVEPLKRNGGRLAWQASTPADPRQQRPVGRIPDILRGLDEQVLLPPLHAGWALRRKSAHFAAYDEVAAEFAQLLQIDPWLLNPYHARCGEIDFRRARRGMPRLQRLDAAGEIASSTSNTASGQRPTSRSRRTPAPTAWA